MEHADTRELEDAAEAEFVRDRAGSGAAPDHLFRLFVGWVPKLFTEADLKPLFEQWGSVKDIIVLKDKVTGQRRGCAFVSYATREEAEAAVQHLDRSVQLPGALNEMEVRFARSHQYVQAGEGPKDNRQLFFAHSPQSTTEADMSALFSRFGVVEEVNLFRERRTKQSKGCGFVTMATRAQALAAMEALDEKHTMEGGTSPLAVKFADPELQAKKRRAVEESNTENRMVFFAKVLRSASEDEVRALFRRFGRVFEVNLFRAFQGAPTTKGCGLVTMGSNDEAVAAIEALDGKHTWEGMDAPMVVKWMDVALQRRRREEHLATMRQASSSQQPQPQHQFAAVGLPDPWALPTGSLSPDAAAALGGLASSGAAAMRGSYGGRQSASGSGQLFDSGPQALAPPEVPPPGCTPDAYKLFVGNVPKSYGEEDLRPLFESVGPVAELVVVRDKLTHDSKGSAFVWYTSKAAADRAAQQLNVRHVLADPSGEQQRPLVVRRANARKPAMLGGAASAPLFATQQQHHHQQQQQQQAGPQVVVPARGMMVQQQPQQQPDPLAYAVPPAGLPPHGGGDAPPPGTVQLQPLVLQAMPQGSGGPPQQQQIVYHPVITGRPTPRGSGSGGALPAQFVVVGPPDGGSGGASGSGHCFVQAYGPIYGGDGAESSVASGSGYGGPFGPMAGSAAASTVASSAMGLPSALLSSADLSSANSAFTSSPGNVVVVAGSAPPPPPAAAPGEPLHALQVPLTARQMALITSHVYSIQMMSGADLTSQAVGPGVFVLQLRGTRVQVELANQLVASVLQTVAP